MEEIDLKELFNFFKGKIGFIITITAAVCILGSIYGFLIQKPMYQSYTVCYGGRFLDKILERKKEEFVCGYISKDGMFPKQEYPIEYNDSLHILFRKDDLLLYEYRKTNAKEHIVRFYDEFCGSMVSYCSKELQDFVDELIKYKLENSDELTTDKCDKLADLYISRLKDDKPKVLTK